MASFADNPFDKLRSQDAARASVEQEPDAGLASELFSTSSGLGQLSAGVPSSTGDDPFGERGLAGCRGASQYGH